MRHLIDKASFPRRYFISELMSMFLNGLAKNVTKRSAGAGARPKFINERNRVNLFDFSVLAPFYPIFQKWSSFTMAEKSLL